MTTSVAALCIPATVAESASPQCQTVYRHLRENPTQGLSQYEATLLYRVAALPRRIADLREIGVEFRIERKRDQTGHAYARYFLADAS